MSHAWAILRQIELIDQHLEEEEVDEKEFEEKKAVQGEGRGQDSKEKD